MAAEYEIKEVGFIGSLWRGGYDSPLNIGKTIEVTNVPNTIETSRRQSIFITAKEGIDIVRLNSQLPDVEFQFEFGKLTDSELEDISIHTKIDKTFLQQQEILFRYNTKALMRGINASSIPLQENWSFDTTDPYNVKYIYNDPTTSIFANYVILVDSIYQDQLVTYFESLQQESLPVPVIPPSVQPVLVSTVSAAMLPPPPQIQGGIFEEPVGEDEIERLAIERFETQFELIGTDVPIENIDPIFTAGTNAEINASLKLISEREEFLERVLADPGNTFASPFSAIRGIRVEQVYLRLVRNYLLDRFRQLNDVGFATDEPERYSFDEDGNIIIEPRVISDPPPTVIVNENIDRDFSEFDDFIDEIIEDLETDDNNVYVFKKVSKIADYSLPTLRYKTKGLFKCTGEKLSTYYTGSLSSKQQRYYTSVFNEQPGTTDSYHQFDITYCHISGSGSSYVEGEVDYYPAKTMYRKYMLECFGNTAGKFPFKNGKNGDYFYAIQLDRTQYKEKLDAGNFELSLCELSSSGTVTHPTSTRFFTLIDDSKDTKQEIVTNEGIQEFYYITSGSLRDGVYNEVSDDAWGVVFPKMGLIVLDGAVLDQSCSFSTVTSSTDGQNANRLFLAISGAAVPNAYRPSGSFFARSFETFLTETYFCRAEPTEFNLSTNYTYVSGSYGLLKYDYFKNRPSAYITTIGLYNRKKELLAVGKLRNPILKTEGKICTFEVVVRLN
jgi:hypothetical protein